MDPSSMGHLMRRAARLPGRAASVLAILLLASAAGLVGIHAAPQETIYHPKLTVPETLEPFLKYLEPGSDAFASERDVTELDAQLAALGDLLRNGKAAGVSE